MIVDGIELLRMIRDGKFEDGDEIISNTTIITKYEYSSLYNNFTNVKTGTQLTVQEYVFWSFYIPEENKEIDIQAIEKISIRPFTGFTDVCEYIEKKGNEIIKAVKQLDKKLKE